MARATLTVHCGVWCTVVAAACFLGTACGVVAPSEEAESGDSEIALPSGCVRKVAAGSSISDDASLAAIDGATSIEGDLTLTGSVTSTEPLRCLTQVTGELRVVGVPLEALELPELVHVGTVTIAQTSALRTVDLSALTEIGDANGESMRIEAATSLEQLNVSSLKEMGGLVLQSLGADTGVRLDMNFASLEQLGSLWMRSAEALEVLEWGNLETVTGELRIEQSPRLETIAFGNLRQVGTVLIGQAPALRTVDLSGVVEIGDSNGESMRVEAATSLEQLNVSSLKEMGGLVLQNLGASTGVRLDLNFAAIEQLGSLWMRDADALEALEWENLATVTGELRIEQSHRLETVAFGNLRQAGTILIGQTAALRTVDLSALTNISEANGESMRVEAAQALEQLNVSSVEALAGLVLQTLGADAQAPLSLDFEKLSLLSSLYLRGTALTDLNGFESVTQVSGELTITENAALSTCAARAFAVQAMQATTATISSNLVDPACDP